MKIISTLSLLLLVHASRNGDSNGNEGEQAESEYIPRPKVVNYAEKNALSIKDFSKQDHTFVLSYFANRVETDLLNLAKWQLRLSAYLKDFIWSENNIQISDIMDLLTKPIIQKLSKLMNFPKGSESKKLFQSNLDRDVCLTKDFISKLDATQFNHSDNLYLQNFLGMLISGLIHQQRRISYSEVCDDRNSDTTYPCMNTNSQKYKEGFESRVKCFNTLIEVTSSIIKTYSQGDITLDMLVKDDLLGWRISGEEFFKFPDTYGKHMELIYMTTNNIYQETFALHLLRYGSAKVIAKMILLNISLEDVVPGLSSATCYRGFLDKLLLNNNLTPEDRRLFLEALLPLFTTMNHKCLWGENWNSLSDFETYQADFGFSEPSTKEDEKLMKQIKMKREFSKDVYEKQVRAFDRWTTTFDERLGFKKGHSCPVYELEQAYNLGQMNLLEEDQKQEVCARAAKFIKEHAHIELWSLLDVKYQTAGEAYETLCESAILKDEEDGIISSIFLKASPSKQKKNRLLKDLKDRADNGEYAAIGSIRLPDEDFRRSAIVFKHFKEEAALDPFNVPIMQEVFHMINESEELEFVNPFVMKQILKSNVFVEFLKSFSLRRQYAIAHVILYKSQEIYQDHNEDIYNMFLEALKQVDVTLYSMFSDACDQKQNCKPY